MNHCQPLRPVVAAVMVAALDAEAKRKGEALTAQQLAVQVGLSRRYAAQLLGIMTDAAPELIAAWRNHPETSIQLVDRIRRLDHMTQRAYVQNGTIVPLNTTRALTTTVHPD